MDPGFSVDEVRSLRLVSIWVVYTTVPLQDCPDSYPDG